MIRQRVQIRFAKQGDLRWSGHQDLARAVERLLRRAGVQLSMSEGFRPRPRISFPLSLSVGIAATDEVLEFEAAEQVEPDRLADALARHPLPGFSILSIALVPEGRKKAEVESVELKMPVPDDRREDLGRRIADFLAAERWLRERAGRRAPIDLRSDLLELELEPEGLRMRISIGREASAHPRELLAALGLGDLEEQGYYLTRTAVCLRQRAAAARGS